MAWCRQATSHYLNQYWQWFVTPCDITGPQWVNRAYSTISKIKTFKLSRIILWKCPANERRCCIVTSSPIGWAHTQKDAPVFSNGYLLCTICTNSWPMNQTLSTISHPRSIAHIPWLTGSQAFFQSRIPLHHFLTGDLCQRGCCSVQKNGVKTWRNTDLVLFGFCSAMVVKDRGWLLNHV